MIDHCVTAANRRSRRENSDIYIAERLREIETALGGQDIPRLSDFIFPVKAVSGNGRKSAEDIVNDIAARAGLKEVGDETDGSSQPEGNAGP